jgi:hypothetical protein
MHHSELSANAKAQLAVSGLSSLGIITPATTH